MAKKILINETQLRRMLSEIASSEIDIRTNEVDTSPTEKQKEAGNYRMAHISVRGMKIAIENPKGSKRYYKNDKGELQYNVMKNHYGYFNITKGKDGDAVDVFLGPNLDDFENVYCVDQNNKKGEFDETKVMLGFLSKGEAKDAYFANYSPNWKGFREITGVSLETFKKWLYRGRKQRQPFADYVEIQKKELNEDNKIYDQQKYEEFKSYVEYVKERIQNYFERPSEDKLNSWAKSIDRGKITPRDRVGYRWDTSKVFDYCRSCTSAVDTKGSSFVQKAIDRAMTELKAQGFKFHYYNPL